MTEGSTEVGVPMATMVIDTPISWNRTPIINYYTSTHNWTGTALPSGNPGTQESSYFPDAPSDVTGNALGNHFFASFWDPYGSYRTSHINRIVMDGCCISR